MVHIASLTPEQRGATKFQALFRGYLTRKYTVLPTPSLTPLIATQINAFVKEARHHKIDVTSELSEGKKKFIKWDKKLGVLTLLFSHEDAVGSGFWKKCFSGHTVKIPLPLSQKEIKPLESVWIEGDIAKEVEIQKFLFDRFREERPKGVYFLEPWEHIHKNVYTQRRLINKVEFPDPLQKALGLRDIARTLAWIHQQRVVHGDVHLKNILFEEQRDEDRVVRLVPYLTDFGSAKIWGADPEKLDDYVRWDACKCFAGINTPLMDWQGFIVTTIVSWFPEMTSYLKWEKFKLIRRIVFENECKGTFLSAEVYWIGYKPFIDLTRWEQGAWNLFIALCRTSAQLYLAIKHTVGEITAEEVEKAMLKVPAADLIKECLQFADDMCDGMK